MDFNFEQAVKNAKRVNGWLSDVEANKLYTLAREGSGQGIIIEIGSWQGKSTILLASGSKSVNREKVYAIDPFEGYNYVQADLGTELQKRLEESLPKTETYTIFINNIHMASIGDWVIPFRGKSGDMFQSFPKQPVRLLFIDGHHDEIYVQQDYEQWGSMVTPGGYIVFHDIGLPGPAKWFKIMSESGLFCDIERVGDGMGLGRIKEI